MAKPNPMERKLYLKSTIDRESIIPLIETINKINDDDSEKEKEYKDWVREPILLYIYTYGGVCYAGFALIDAIKASKTPVHTIVLGTAMSMGLPIFLAGHKRLIGSYATLHFHDISCGFNGQVPTEEIKIQLEEGLRLEKLIDDMIISSSLVTQETLDDIIKRKADWYIPADEAIKLKLADEYYK